MPRLRISTKPSQRLLAESLVEELAVDEDRWIPLAKPSSRISATIGDNDSGMDSGADSSSEAGDAATGSDWEPG